MDTKQNQFNPVQSLGKLESRCESSGEFSSFSVCLFVVYPRGKGNPFRKLVYRLNDSIVLFDTFHIYFCVSADSFSFPSAVDVWIIDSFCVLSLALSFIVS